MRPIELIGAHRDRPTAFLRLWKHDGWRMKVYGVAYGRERPRARLVSAGERLAASYLPRPAFDGSRYGVGFIVVHDGRGGNWVLVDWWANDNELNQLLFQADGDDSFDLRRVESPLIACVHEMRVVVHEYRAWIDTVLANPAGPNPDAYLSRTAL